MYLRTSAKDLFQCLFVHNMFLVYIMFAYSEKRNERGLLIAILMRHPKIDRTVFVYNKVVNVQINSENKVFVKCTV